MMHGRRRLSALVLLIASLAAGRADAAAPKNPIAVDPFDQSQLAGLEWRCVGPYRGGRVTAVTGVVGQRNVYYFGGTGGGVWKSVNSGVSWQNVSTATSPPARWARSR